MLEGGAVKVGCDGDGGFAVLVSANDVVPRKCPAGHVVVAHTRVMRVRPVRSWPAMVCIGPLFVHLQDQGLFGARSVPDGTASYTHTFSHASTPTNRG
jgi:hypothetical protein